LTKASERDELPKKKPKILIVDDNPTQLYVLTRISDQAGYECTEAQSGEDAWEQLEREIPDVVVCDVKLPQMDGFELCRKIRDRLKARIPLILVTSMYYASEREAADTAKGKKKAKECGALDLFPRGEAIQKLPVLLQTLAAKVK